MSRSFRFKHIKNSDITYQNSLISKCAKIEQHFCELYVGISDITYVKIYNTFFYSKCGKKVGTLKCGKKVGTFFISISLHMAPHREVFGKKQILLIYEVLAF